MRLCVCVCRRSQCERRAYRRKVRNDEQRTQSLHSQAARLPASGTHDFSGQPNAKQVHADSRESARVIAFSAPVNQPTRQPAIQTNGIAGCRTRERASIRLVLSQEQDDQAAAAAARRSDPISEKSLRYSAPRRGHAAARLASLSVCVCVSWLARSSPWPPPPPRCYSSCLHNSA